jgi:hypothetical protein
MKRFYFIVLMVLLFKLPVDAQTTYWSDDFFTNQGWTSDGNWSIDGGMMVFYWSPEVQNFDFSSISPVIHLIDNTNELIVSQYLDVYSTGSDEMAEISVIYGNQEDIIWSYALSNGNWGVTSGEELVIQISEYEGMDVQFKFRTYGATTFNWNWWNIFEMKLNANLNTDLAVADISGPVQVDLQMPGIWEVQVKNLGTQPVSDFTVKLFNYKTGDLIGSFDDTEQIQSQETKSYSFSWSSNAAYNTAFYGVVTFEGDEFTGNNISKSHFVRINPDIDFSILVWDNDNEIENVTDPEQGDEVLPSTVLKRALDLAGYDYYFCKALPDNLNDYDIVFATMGCYCVS